MSLDEAQEFSTMKQELLNKKNKMTGLTLGEILHAFVLTLKEIPSFRFSNDEETDSQKKYLPYTSKSIVWILFGAQAIWILLGVILLVILNHFFPILSGGSLTFLWIIVPFSLISILSYLFLRLKPFTWYWQSTCFFYSVSAAESLEKDKLVDGSFYVDKLISFINQFSKTTKVEVYKSKTCESKTLKVKVKELFHDNIEDLSDLRYDAVKAVRESGVLSWMFSRHLYMLANSLFSYSKENISNAYFSLCFLNENIKKCHEDTFLDSHKTTNSNLKIFTEFSKIVLIPIVLPFILWLVFRYPHV
ncbi:MAG: hypothetical protein ACXV2C_07655 [Candidatus Bathyarchaeia archaeon]